MNDRLLTAAALALLIGFSAFAQTAFERGDVVVQMSSTMGWEPYTQFAEIHVLDPNGVRKEADRRFSPPPYASGFLIPDARRAFFASRALGVTLWRDGSNGLARPVNGLNLQDPGQVLQTRSGDLLVAERRRAGGKPRLVRFTAAGDLLWIYELPDPPLARPNESNSYLGAQHMELLGDQCTLLWATSSSRRVRVFNVCTGEAAHDLMTMPSDVDQIGSIRKLPNGDLLIGADRIWPAKSVVRRFDAAGNHVASHSELPSGFGGETLLALTPEGTGFWVAKDFVIQRIDFDSPGSAIVSTEIRGNYLNALGVVGEWRAATHTAPRRRAVVAH